MNVVGAPVASGKKQSEKYLQVLYVNRSSSGLDYVEEFSSSEEGNNCILFQFKIIEVLLNVIA